MWNALISNYIRGKTGQFGWIRYEVLKAFKLVAT
jgi:hypothetical protein